MPRPDDKPDSPGKSGDAPGRAVSEAAHARNDARKADRDKPGVTDTTEQPTDGVDVAPNTPTEVNAPADPPATSPAAEPSP